MVPIRGHVPAFSGNVALKGLRLVNKGFCKPRFYKRWVIDSQSSVPYLIKLKI